ncbi:MAG: hypothetical protein AB7Q17_02375 [Phycisphaerae bacterium]
MSGRRGSLAAALGAVALAGGVLLFAQANHKPQEQERSIAEKEVPAAALAALRKLAGDAKITEYAEEIEHGHTYYEGSWKGPDGHVDVLVTPAGDVVEIEEAFPADRVPAGPRAAAAKEAGADAAMKWERKTLYLYEAHFKRDGRGREILFTADGRRFHEESDADRDEHEDRDDDGAHKGDNAAPKKEPN